MDILNFNGLHVPYPAGMHRIFFPFDKQNFIVGISDGFDRLVRLVREIGQELVRFRRKKGTDNNAYFF